MSFKHNRTIAVEFGQLQHILDWCDAQCTGRWAFMDPPDYLDHDSWTFLFDSDEDYTLFLLRWT